MQITESVSDGLARVFSVHIPRADLEAQLSAKIQEVQPNVRLNGFRPGKVPPAHIRKVYGAAMMREIIDAEVQKSTSQSLERNNLRPAGQPQLDLKSDVNQVMEGKADLDFDLKVEIMPDIEPVDVSTVAVTRPVAAVEDAQIEEALGELAKASKVYEDKDGAAETDDAVTIDFVGKLDGEAFEGGSAEDATLTIGAGRFIPGFEEHLIGVKAGEEKTFEVTFPEDYPVETLKGRPATFETKVKAVKAPKTPDINDALAQQFGLESLGALREALQKRIEADHAAQSRAKAKRALFDKLDAAHDFPLPPGMVEAEFNQIWSQIDADRKAGRLDADEADKPEDELKAEYRKIAERRVRLGLLLAEIGRRNKVEVSNEEVGQAVAEQARRFPGQERQVFEAYQKNPGLLAQIRAPLYEEKVVDFVLELAQVTNETVSREALFAEDDEPGAGA
ncbi:MAG: trigger factor [Alphaproteobacteria bacterium]|nr:trigger factor [Alphaproteobacteria bacterium]